jgi:hypothetical protein
VRAARPLVKRAAADQPVRGLARPRAWKAGGVAEFGVPLRRPCDRQGWGAGRGGEDGELTVRGMEGSAQGCTTRRAVSQTPLSAIEKAVPARSWDRTRLLATRSSGEAWAIAAPSLDGSGGGGGGASA